MSRLIQSLVAIGIMCIGIAVGVAANQMHACSAPEYTARRIKSGLLVICAGDQAILGIAPTQVLTLRGPCPPDVPPSDATPAPAPVSK